MKKLSLKIPLQGIQRPNITILCKTRLRLLSFQPDFFDYFTFENSETVKKYFYA